MVAPIPAKRGRKPAVATAPATGQVQSLTRGLKLLEWIAESNGSVALTELAQQAGLPNSTTHRLLTTMQPPPQPETHIRDDATAFRLANWDTGQSAHMPLWSVAAFFRVVIC